MSGLLTGLLLVSSGVNLLPAGEVEVTGRSVRIGDVARLEALPATIRSRVAERVIALLPARRQRVTLARSAVAGLIRRSIPGIQIEGGAEGEIILRLADEPHPSAPVEACRETVHPIATGAVLTHADVAVARCRSARTAAALVYDRIQSVTRAAADLPARTYLGRVSLADRPRALAGDTLTLASNVGPVRIERRVTALQAGRVGKRMFVRTEDGAVVAAVLAGDPNREGGE